MNEAPRILVTGATGFIGSRVSVALVRRGATVIALARSGSDHCRLLSTGAKVCVVEGDYHAEHEIRRVLEEARPTIPVHSAWRIDVGSACLHAVSNLADVRASLRLFEMASEAGLPAYRRDRNLSRVRGIGRPRSGNDRAPPEDLVCRRAKAALYYLKQWERWDNPADGVTVEFERYPVPSRWRRIFDEPAPVQANFRQAAWDVPGAGPS